jgi:hypothetical protein
MTKIAAQAKPAIEKLMQSDLEQLYQELGIRLKALAADAAVAGSFDPEVSYEPAVMGLMDDVKAFAKKFFEKMSREAYGLICGGGLTSEEQKKLTEALGNKVDFATWLAAVLVAHLALAPAAAAVVAALVVRLFFKPAHAAMCEVWASKLGKAGG